MSAFDLGLPFPQTVFYPSLAVNLQIRFDEGVATIPGLKSPDDLGGPNSVPSAPKPAPAVTAPSSTDNLSHVLGIVPKSCSVELAGYRQAGTFNIDMEYKDLPLDPRVVRAMSVAIHIDAVPAGDFADGMTPSTPLQAGRRKSVIRTTDKNLVLAGIADVIAVEYGRGGSSIHIEGRDLRGILLDTNVSAQTLKSIDLSKNIKQVVEHIVQDLHPQGAGIQVVVQESEWPSGLPSPKGLTSATRASLDSLGKQVRAVAAGAADKIKFWDLITSYCFLVGAIPHFVGSNLRIRPVRSLFDARNQENPAKQFDTKFPTPFLNGQKRAVGVPIAHEFEQFAYRRLVFGKDIDELKFERKLAGTKVPCIKCVSIDTSNKSRGLSKKLEVQYPPQTEIAARTTHVGAGGAVPSTEFITIQVPGIKDKDRLTQIATDLYHEVGRQEMGGSVQTKNLSSFGGSNQDPDLLKLRPGDPLEFRVDASGLATFPPPISELTQHAGRSFEQEVAEVKSRIGDERLARVLVSINRGQNTQLQRVFRTANVRFEWGNESGIAISCDFQNFLEARYGLNAPPSPGPG